MKKTAEGAQKHTSAVLKFSFAFLQGRYFDLVMLS